MSKIEWTDKTWNPTTGCTKCAAGCKNCYAAVMHKRLTAMGQPKYSEPFDVVRCHPAELEKPLHWRKPRKVFVNSMSDLFHPDVPFEFIDEVLAVMALTPHITYQVLTKRPERMREYLCAADPHRLRNVAYSMVNSLCERRTLSQRLVSMYAGQTRDLWAVRALDTFEQWPLPNVWLGTSVSNQEDADRNIPDLLETPAAVRFVSYEPAVGPVDFRPWLGGECTHEDSYVEPDTNACICSECDEQEFLDQIIMGGESGPNARPMHPNWARDVRDQCVAADVPFFMKQIHLDGDPKRLSKNPDEWPAELRLREFPNGL